MKVEMVMREDVLGSKEFEVIELARIPTAGDYLMRHRGAHLLVVEAVVLLCDPEDEIRARIVCGYANDCIMPGVPRPWSDPILRRG